MKHQKQLNKAKYQDVTIADVKACKGYEDISDDMAQKIVDAIRVYTEIIYNRFKEGSLPEQQAKVIAIGKTDSKKAA